jgi:hypothetical protein
MTISSSARPCIARPFGRTTIPFWSGRFFFGPPESSLRFLLWRVFGRIATTGAHPSTTGPAPSRPMSTVRTELGQAVGYTGLREVSIHPFDEP